MAGPRFDFDAMFDEDYLYFYGPHLTQVAEADTELIWRVFGLEPGIAMLDLACGHGRIANGLAARGARVTGLDATPAFLAVARAQAAQRGLAVDYVQSDMRELPFADGSFARVLSWFTSFGYFDEADNRRVLAEAHRVLAPGGRLLLEANNLAELLPRWAASTVIERDGDLAIDRAQFDPVSGYSTTERTIVRDGRVRRLHFSVRMFMASELAAWLHGAGFAEVAFCGREGEPLTVHSRRMIAVATRSA